MVNDIATLVTVLCLLGLPAALISIVIRALCKRPVKPLLAVFAILLAVLLIGLAVFDATYDDPNDTDADDPVGAQVDAGANADTAVVVGDPSAEGAKDGGEKAAPADPDDTDEPEKPMGPTAPAAPDPSAKDDIENALRGFSLQ